MTGRNLRWLPVAATLLLAACGGGTTPTTGPGGGTAGPGPTAGSGQGQATAAPIATPGGGPGGGGFTGGPCSLLTAAEIEAATGVTNAVGTETPMQNGSGGCGWVGDDVTMGAAISVTTGDAAKAVYETWKTQAGSEAIPGIGDGTIYVPSAGTIFILKGATLIGLSAGPFSAEPDVKRENGIELARVIAGKL